jgi:O-antigen ligase
VLLFLQVSIFHQTLAYLTGLNLHLLYVFGIPALVGVVLGGGIQSAFRGRPAIYWVGFAAWMTLAVPFSYWRGGSTVWLLGYLRANLVMLFIVGGLAVTWRDCKAMMSATALGAAVVVSFARLFQFRMSGYRGGIEFGTVSNPNDFAGHLLFALPFLLWVVVASRAIVLRVAALAGIGYGIYCILGSASRGALVGLIGAALFFLWRGTMRQRIVLLMAAPIAAVVLVAVVPRPSLLRITNFSTTSDGGAPGSDEAVASTQGRRYLLETSIYYAIHNPLVGVGPGQFSGYEGEHSRVVAGRRGRWQEAHNSYTTAASECGIPAFLLYMAAIFSTFRLLNSVFREAGNRPEFEDIRAAAFCIQVSLVGFCIAIFFLNFTYFFYLPVLSGLAIAVAAAAKQEFQFRGLAVSEPGIAGNFAGAGWRAQARV